MVSPGIKKSNPNSLSWPSHNVLSLWADKLQKRIPSCGLMAATRAQRFGSCEPLCSAQPLQLYWDALHEALQDLGPAVLFKRKSFLLLCHSCLSHTLLSSPILKYAKLFPASGLCPYCSLCLEQSSLQDWFLQPQISS